MSSDQAVSPIQTPNAREIDLVSEDGAEAINYYAIHHATKQKILAKKILKSKDTQIFYPYYFNRRTGKFQQKYNLLTQKELFR